MHQVQTEIHIQASPRRVWQVLTDFSQYAQWNPFIRSLDGALVPGGRLVVRIQPPGSRGMTFKPRVCALEPERELRWLGHLLWPGLFDGEHCFRIEPVHEGVRFVHAETFSGWLVPLFRKSLDGATRDGFIAMNRALKERAESGTTG